MAQPALDEVTSSSLGQQSNFSNVTSTTASRVSTPTARASPGARASSFQPINSRASAENARISSPAVSGSQRASSSDLTPRSDALVTRHPPQAAQTSDSTSRASKAAMQNDNLDTVMADTNYGTRSRNRTNARPNYAEDQDMDFEFSSAATTHTKKKDTDALPTATSGQMANGSKRAPEHTGFLAVNSNGSGPTAEAKEQVSAISQAAAPPLKKRKAAGTAVSNLQTSALASTPPPTAARKPGTTSSSAMVRETNIMTFIKHRNCLNKKGELVADDGTKLSVNDHVYLVCEPPGDPYYLCRVMEFLHVASDNPNSPVDSLRVNWYYRPRDVQRFSSDTRLVYGTMHSDMCPLTSLRGKCIIKHRSEIADLEAYRKERDSFYFTQVFDRFIRRSYECIPVREIINVPDKVKKALDERWKLVVVEIGRVKELTSAAKSCKRCARYCASNESVDCALCKNSYHMACVQPPLPKKPSRGFAWACGPCSRASERKMEARNTPTLSANGTDAEEEEPVEEDALAVSDVTTRAPSPSGDDMMIDEHPATQAEIALAKMWPMRYLGIHARVEDALQYDDRAIYPRASSRLGPRHQANTNVWHGRPVELVKAAEIKKRYNKGNAQKTQGKLTKETVAAMDADREERARRPKWVQDEPPGYVARGEDYDNKDPRCTARRLFAMPKNEESEGTSKHQEVARRNEALVDDFLKKAKVYAKGIGVPPFGANFIDKALELFVSNKYNFDTTIKQLVKIDRVKDLHEPVLTKSELTRFEEGVSKYGSEHRLIRLHMKTNLPHADVVRFYYLWKKTPKGREIWGNYGGRKKRKLESDAGAKLQAEVAKDNDDSAFDNDRAAKKHHGFQCKFCHTLHSRQWRRAPGVSPGQTVPAEKQSSSGEKKEKRLLALCLRCAGLWRKYAIEWEDIDDASRKVALGGKGTLKRKIDEELLRELLAANEAASATQDQGLGPSALDGSGEPPKKKSKLDKDMSIAAAEAQKKKEKPLPPPKEPTPPPPPIIPSQATWKTLPCAVCKELENTIACQHCKLTVHRACFGLRDNEGVRANGEVNWICEQCQNDRNPTVSTEYSCCLCLTEETLVDLVEPPRVSHKKKTDREREKERMEKELADAMRADYRNRQLALNRPPLPREPLKRTTGNNWAHVYCTIWTPEIRFSNARTMEVAEGFQLIPQPKFEAVCKLCKNKDHQNRVRENAGACVSCFQCNASFHASCAFEAGYNFGFDVQPVKGSRKDQVTTATLGQETGSLTAVIFCKEHVVKSIVHPVNEAVGEDGTTALQVYTQNYKQADLTLTGTVRKANIAQSTKDKAQQATSAPVANNRRESGAHSIAAAVRRGARTSVAENKAEEDGRSELSNGQEVSVERRCTKCDVDVTPKWHPIYKDEATEKSEQLLNFDMPREDAVEANNSESYAIQRFESSQLPPRTNGQPSNALSEHSGHRPDLSHAQQPVENANSINNNRPHTSIEINRELRSQHNAIIREGDDVFHNHALPQFQNPALPARPAMGYAEMVAEPILDGYLCHKCFLKKKLDPTPPPEDRRPTLSPGQQYPLHEVGSQPPPSTHSDPQQVPSLDQQFKVWDDPPPPPPPPAPAGPPLNGMGPPPPGYEGFEGFGHHPPPPPPGLGYPPPPQYGAPNGYHLPPQPPPMHDGLPPSHFGPPPMHERHNSYGYPPHPSPHPPQYAPAAPHPPPMNGYAPPPPHQGQHPQQHPSHQPPHHASHQPAPHQVSHPQSFQAPYQQMTNGAASPHNGAPPPLRSPSAGPLQHQYPPPPMQHTRTDAPYHAALPPLGGPTHSSPESTFGRPTQQPHQPLEIGNGQSRPPHQQPPPPTPMASQPSQQSAVSPQMQSAGVDGQRPRTPHGGQTNGTGASASPNLNYLIH